MLATVIPSLVTRIHNIRRNVFPTTVELRQDLDQTQKEIVGLLQEYTHIASSTHREVNRRMWMISFTLLPQRYNKLRILKKKLGEPIS
jgi:hypothetical protein